MKFKTYKEAPITNKKVSRYDSRAYNTVVSSTDIEILAVIKALGKFKIFVISSKEFTLRTDCQAIISFYDKKAENKSFLNRWLTFVDYIVGTRFHVNIEPIKEVNNFIANKFSRMIEMELQNQQK